MSNSSITISDHGTTYSGKDATRLYQALSLKGAIALYLKTKIKPTRLHTPSAMAVMAGHITGKQYTRSHAGLQQAHKDLAVWCEAMKAALPVEDERT